jgi:hypothetical protein
MKIETIKNLYGVPSSALINAISTHNNRVLIEFTWESKGKPYKEIVEVDQGVIEE